MGSRAGRADGDGRHGRHGDGHEPHPRRRRGVRDGMGRHDGRDDAAERPADDQALRGDPAERSQRLGKDRPDRAVCHHVSRDLGPVGRSDLLRERRPQRHQCPSACLWHRLRPRRRRRLPGLAAQASVSPALPERARVPPRPLARRLARRPGDGRDARAVLSGMLLGADARPGRGGCDGADLGPAHRRRRGGRKAPAARRVDRADVGVALVLLGVAVAVRPGLAVALRAGGHSM